MSLVVASQIKNQMMEEFDKEARVMDIKIKNIIERGKSNFTQFTGPLTDQTPFPAAVAAEFAYLAEDEAAFYEELGGKGGVFLKACSFIYFQERASTSIV